MATNDPEDSGFTMPLAVRVKDACRLIGIGRSKLYLLIMEGRIETIKLGSITLIPVSSLQRLLKPEKRDISEAQEEEA